MRGAPLLALDRNDKASTTGRSCGKKVLLGTTFLQSKQKSMDDKFKSEGKEMEIHRRNKVGT